jgi:hypothetical protein
MKDNEIARLNKLGTELLQLVAVFPQLLSTCLPRHKPIDAKAPGGKERLAELRRPYEFVFSWLNDYYEIAPSLLRIAEESDVMDIPADTRAATEWQQLLNSFLTLEKANAGKVNNNNPFYVAFKNKFFIFFTLLSNIELTANNAQYNDTQRANICRVLSHTIFSAKNLAQTFVQNSWALQLLEQIEVPVTPPTPPTPIIDNDEENEENENDDENSTVEACNAVTLRPILKKGVSLLGLYIKQQQRLSDDLLPSVPFLKRGLTF